MIIGNWIAYVLTVIGALNWGLVGIFDFNLVSVIFGGYRSAGAIVVYILILLAALWMIISPIINFGRISLMDKDRK
ncbi:MAG: DUF378 domain-containing protein [Clostridia bacterium]|nr:DUF378 domain-containing protein [Clostridia bacterium]